MAFALQFKGIGLNRIAPQQDLTEILKELVVGAELVTAVLITRDGHKVVAAGETRTLDTTALAALVAGMFSATREVARLVGEEQFSILLQQGERRHLHISLINDTIMMVLVFEDYQRIGRVRYEARKAGTVIADALRLSASVPSPRPAARTAAPEILAPDAVIVPADMMVTSEAHSQPEREAFEPRQELTVEAFREYALNLIDRLFEVR